MTSKSSRWSILLGMTLLGQLLVKQICADLVATFTYPVENGLTFYDGQTINVSWTSTLDKASLTLFCVDRTKSSGLAFIVNAVDNVKPIGSTLVFVNFKVSSDYCWFNIFETGHRGNGVNSVTFLLSAGDRSETTLGLSGVATTSFAASGVPTGPAKPAAPSSKTSLSLAGASTLSTQSSISSLSSPTFHPSEGGLSTGANVGIGVGVGVGVGALVVLGGFVYWLLRLKRAKQTQSILWVGNEGVEKAAGQGTSVAAVYELGEDRQLPAELGTITGTIFELPEGTAMASPSQTKAKKTKKKKKFIRRASY
ncbi:hypothetical protein HIM_10935 [Hirsutella minnesotensis 3608]|uniref:Mid2 domain-containing protein n=1 Tax=Hirsutella minnesotensis 3608 TaxID=1043627 RepID=A0A0F8A1S9_9HYPO|nr:hypothetical protein HIM_10935 [Hirsutella minnesotensis 3608]